MPCSKQTTARYTSPTRKSPPRKSKDCKGKRRTGLDGRLWVSKRDVNGVYRWVRVTEDKPHSVRAGRACGSATRTAGRWTRAELQELAVQQGIPYNRRTPGHSV